MNYNYNKSKKQDEPTHMYVKVFDLDQSIFL